MAARRRTGRVSAIVGPGRVFPILRSPETRVYSSGKLCVPRVGGSAVRHLAVAAMLQRLIGEPCVIFAIGRAFARLVPAEAEILGTWIADRPFAGLVRDMEDGHPPVPRQIDQPQGLGLGNRQGARLRLGAHAGL